MRAAIVCSAAFVAFLVGGQQALAQEWASKMFDSLRHDFGTVARGAECVHRFTFTNLYKEDVHVAAVRSSCGCTTPEITKRTLKSWETSEIVAIYNTRAFLGSRSAVLTVVIDQPFPAEVQLHVTGYIRSDVVLNPGSIKFGNVRRGEVAERPIDIDYAGRADWRIVDVRTTNPHLEAQLLEKRRETGLVSYQMIVRLTKEAPIGYLNEQLQVITNDTRLQQFPIDVEGKVESEVTVSPSPLFLGVLKPGQKATKKLVVRSKEPFKIASASCDEASFQITVPEAAKAIHLLDVTFTADKPGKVSGMIRIESELGEGVIPGVPVYAQVVEP